MSKGKSDLARISSDLHRRVKIAAAKAGISMKTWLDGAVQDKLRRKVADAA